MTSTSIRPGNYNQQTRDPNTAAFLSLIVPGLGQMYNGETRKGALFICVYAMNLLLFLSMALNEPILNALQSFGTSFHMKPNKMLLLVLHEAYLGSAVSFVLLGFFIAYTAYAVRDAYDHAALKRRRIYPDFVIELPEATSGSYIFHFALMVALFVIAFFFIIPPQPKSQITDIEFIQNQPPTQKKVQSKRKAEHNSKAAGKHNPTKPVQAPQASGAKQASKAAKQQQAAKSPPTPAPKQPSPAPSRPTPSPSPSPSPSPRPMPTPQPRMAPSPTPAPTPQAMPRPMAPTPRMSPSPVAMPSPMPTPMAAPRAIAHAPMPTMAPSALARPGSGAGPAMPTAMARPSGGVSGLPSLAPSPVSIGGGGLPGFAPMPKASSGGGGGGFGSPAPTPIAAGGGTGGGHGSSPSPMPVSGGGRSGGSSSGGSSGAPAPSRAGRGSSGGGGWASGPVAIMPSVPRAGTGGGDGTQGNPDANNNPGGKPSVDSTKDVDFGPYMADLQRRIKRAWFPPRGQESRRVVVIFKVHSGGELSDLRIDKTSGTSLADQAALQAVTNAAPFRPLPSGAPNVVDIQFTFDYNVFGGSGRGSFRAL
ncbi:MAG: TonB family protein [Candidatus Obscuribacterales bacterium]|nr:TonB family protein [Candidatus Obscuribacterales bacterium]